MQIHAVFALYRLSTSTTPEAILEALEVRKCWARAMLENPKWRYEARKVLQNWKHHRRRMLAFANVEGVSGEDLQLLDQVLRGLTVSGLSKPDQLRQAAVQAGLLGLDPEVGTHRFKGLFPGIELGESFDLVLEDDEDSQLADPPLFDLG